MTGIKTLILEEEIMRRIIILACLLFVGFAITCVSTAHAEDCAEICKNKPAGPVRNACLVNCAKKAKAEPATQPTKPKPAQQPAADTKATLKCPPGTKLSKDPDIYEGQAFCGVYCPLEERVVPNGMCKSCESVGAQVSEDGKGCVKIRSVPSSGDANTPDTSGASFNDLSGFIVALGIAFVAIFCLFMWALILKRKRDTELADMKTKWGAELFKFSTELARRPDMETIDKVTVLRVELAKLKQQLDEDPSHAQVSALGAQIQQLQANLGKIQTEQRPLFERELAAAEANLLRVTNEKAPEKPDDDIFVMAENDNINPQMKALASSMVEEYKQAMETMEQDKELQIARMAIQAAANKLQQVSNRENDLQRAIENKMGEGRELTTGLNPLRSAILNKEREINALISPPPVIPA